MFYTTTILFSDINIDVQYVHYDSVLKDNDCGVIKQRGIVTHIFYYIRHVLYEETTDLI